MRNYWTFCSASYFQPCTFHYPASSRIIIGGFSKQHERSKAFVLTTSLLPLSPMLVWIPFGNSFTIHRQFFETTIISSVASGLPNEIFAFMVSLNNMLSCVTNPIKPKRLQIHILYVSPINTDCTFVHIKKRVSKLAIVLFRFGLSHQCNGLSFLLEMKSFF
jgi:hypothetical protein